LMPSIDVSPSLESRQTVYPLRLEVAPEADS
jgi:hypothetical protein